MDVDDTRRWVLQVMLVLVPVGLIAFARGPDHHHGPQQVGAHAEGAPTASA